MDSEARIISLPFFRLYVYNRKGGRMTQQFQVFKAMSPSPTGELKALEQESFKEAKELLAKNPSNGRKVLLTLMNNLDLLKIVYDMYVWQRVDAIKAGITRAI